MKNRILLVLCLLSFYLSSEAQKDNYGAGAANVRFIPSKGLLGGRTDFDYLKLENHPGNSGVPLGGIGVGNVEFAPDGRFARIGLNNIHLPIRKSTASFFSLWYKGAKETAVVRLVRDSLPQYGLLGVEDIYYTGLFPRVEMDFGNSIPGINATIRAFSPLIPHDVKNSSLPVVFFDVDLVSQEGGEVSIAFSWEDFIGRGIKEPDDIKGMDGQLFGQERNSLCNGEAWPERPLEQTYSESWSCGKMQGIRQFASGPLKPKRANFQNYVNEVAVLAESREDVEVSVLPSFNIKETHEAWDLFKQEGRFEDISKDVSLLSIPGKQMGGSAVALKTKLKAKEKKTVRFMLVWFYPEMMIFADAQQSKGNITHFIGHYYFGMGTVGGRIPTEDGWMIDNTGGWIIQLVKDYEQTGDFHYLSRYAGRVYNGMDFLKSLMPEGLNIPIGGTTYDDFTHPPVYSYGASIYLATLRAAQVVAQAMKDTVRENEYKEQFDKTQKDMIRLLWNGRFFSYGCELDGSGRKDNLLFTGQLGGQFVSRYCGWGDVIPMEMTKASLVSQFKISLSKTPDYYANKVWDITLNRGIDNRGSQCWPFYLESYTGYTAWQAGYCQDALDIMKHIQLVHLRQGWTWCQNLWNPAELSYMSAPVVWFSTDVLAGAGLNVPRQELRLAPIVEGKDKVVLPLYYPTFWATLSLDPIRKKALLEITKTFGDDEVVLSKIVSVPNGVAAEHKREIAIPAFTVEKGKMLDLSPYWDQIVQRNTEKSILPRADEVDFLMLDYKE